MTEISSTVNYAEAKPNRLKNVGEKITSFVHEHSPKGRYEEYMKKYCELMDRDTSKDRYEFKKLMDHEAKAYATKQVLKDVVILSVITGGAVVGYKAARNPEAAMQFIKKASQVPADARDALSGLTQQVKNGVSEGPKKVVDAIGNATRIVEQTVVQDVHDATKQTLKNVTADILTKEVDKKVVPTTAGKLYIETSTALAGAKAFLRAFTTRKSA